ncbi:MAG: 16S rRNA (guanine(527)-N(7))-methyltransferase RsmG [Betaproteobacteria bacterium]|jgi:16S rRNA (guanine527-N7)-methyltransferase|nr:16S rRNA (guanine(527)-N(7))-methyltransferase RsmG [Betaproteobacteria bacterium]
MSPDAALAVGVLELGLALQASQRKQLLTYIDLLAKWNKLYNLTAIRDPHEMLSHHVLDSLSIVPHVSGRRFLDVGSGAGLPGVPVAIAQPECEVTLLDSSQKKTAFLQHVAIELELGNTTMCATRVESWHPNQRFDTIASRAFSELAEFVHRSQHLLAEHGVLAAMKGAYPHAEIERLPEGFRIRAVKRLAVPGVAGERHLVLVERATS